MNERKKLFILLISIVFVIVFLSTRHYMNKIDSEVDNYVQRVSLLYISQETFHHLLAIQRELYKLFDEDKGSYTRVKDHMDALQESIETLSTRVGYIFYMGLDDKMFRRYSHHVEVLEVIVHRYTERVQKFLETKDKEGRQFYFKKAIETGRTLEIIAEELNKYVDKEFKKTNNFLPVIIEKFKWLGIITGSMLYVAIVILIYVVFSSCLPCIKEVLPFLKEIKKGNFDVNPKDVQDQCGREIISTFNMLLAKTKEIQETAESMTIIDPLTGAYNRKYFDLRIDEETKRTVRYGSIFSLSIIDIDYFKTINDTYGHQAGDAVLKELVMLIKENSRETDIVARYGGEEFAIISPNTSKSGVLTYVERLRQVVESHKFLDIDRQVTISVGVADSAGKTDYQQIIEEADSNLYVAKNTGRNKCIIGNVAV